MLANRDYEKVVMTENHGHVRNINLQANEHPLVEDCVFSSIEGFVSHLMHVKSYESAGELCRGKDVLDWGCNTGYGMEILAKTAASVSGLDVSERAVIAARQRLGSNAADIQYYKGKRCGFADHSFDVVTSFQVLEHVSDYETYFSEILRVTRPGGLVILATPNAAMRLAPGMKPWNEFHVHEFAPAELAEFLKPRFASVTVRGLFGTDQLYKIERDRVESAKQAALTAPQSKDVIRSLKNYIKQQFPFVLRIKAAMRPARQPAPPAATLDPSELARFSTDDLFYKDEDVNEALDLMAVCRKS
jgi:2-polyprenyl-3-methyl-5-hydroxy-6-metoxy-1,4-benzoquinol methylase